MIRSFEFTRQMQRENLCSEFKVSPFLQLNHLNVVRRNSRVSLKVDWTAENRGILLLEHTIYARIQQ